MRFWIPAKQLQWHDSIVHTMNQAERDEIARRKYLVRGPGDEATKQYILNKYLSSSSEEPKKKKKKKKEKTSIRKGNLGIVDDEDSGWPSAPMDIDAEEPSTKAKEDTEIVQGGVFRGRTDNWQTIRQGEQQTKQEEVEEPEEEEEDEKPVLVMENMDEETLSALGAAEARARVAVAATTKTTTKATATQRSSSNDTGPKMSSGQKAGLLTSEELKQEAARAREAEKQMLEKLKGETGQHAETVYRDETGRKIDPKIKRAEEARQRREAIEREERRMEWGKGLVQRSEEEARKRMLEQEQHKPLAR